MTFCSLCSRLRCVGSCTQAESGTIAKNGEVLTQGEGLNAQPPGSSNDVVCRYSMAQSRQSTT